MARPHRRGRPLAHGPPDEQPAFRSLRPALRPPAAQEIPPHPPPTPCAWIGRKSCRPTSAAMCWAIRRLSGKKYPDRRAEVPTWTSSRSQKWRAARLRLRLVLQGRRVYCRARLLGRLRLHQLDHPGRAGGHPVGSFCSTSSIKIHLPIGPLLGRAKQGEKHMFMWSSSDSALFRGATKTAIRVRGSER